MTQDDLVVRLGKLDTCAVSDALDRLGLKVVEVMESLGYESMLDKAKKR